MYLPIPVEYIFFRNKSFRERDLFTALAKLSSHNVATTTTHFLLYYIPYVLVPVR
jgi:hypothetical protein